MISVCHKCPKSVISDSQLSPSVNDPPVFYYETTILVVFVLSMVVAHLYVNISRIAVNVGDGDSSK